MSTANQNTSSGDRINSTLSPSSLIPSSSRSSAMDSALNKFYSALGVSICVVGIIGNLSVLLAFLAHRRLRTKINGFLVSLAIADLLLTGISIPLEMEWHIRSDFTHGIIVCELMYTIHFLTLTSSSLNLLAISVYRYLTIAYPFLMKLVTPIHVMVTIALVWVYSGITAFLPLMGWRSVPTSTSKNFCNYSMDREFILFVFNVNWLLPAVLVFVFYGLIFRIARIHAIKILKHQVTRECERIRSPLFKGAKTLAKIAAVYLICWFPYVIHVIVIFSGAPYSLPYAVHKAFVFLCYASAAINPFLYAGLCKDFREVFCKCASKACNELSAVLRSIANSPRRIIAWLCVDARENSGQRTEVCSRRTWSACGSSSVYQQQTAATFV